jgi:hypothetical protein
MAGMIHNCDLLANAMLCAGKRREFIVTRRMAVIVPSQQFDPVSRATAFYGLDSLKDEGCAKGCQWKYTLSMQ